jgi:hypothetical protein
MSRHIFFKTRRRLSCGLLEVGFFLAQHNTTIILPFSTPLQDYIVIHFAQNIWENYFPLNKIKGYFLTQ